MDLVDEDDRLDSSADAKLARFLHQDLDVLDRARGRRERNESRARRARDDACERRLSRSRRSPQDHRGDAIARDGVAKETAFAQEILEADDLVERLRPQSLG